jgi:uncharacterized protein YbjQ (UPF0145 family)
MSRLVSLLAVPLCLTACARTVQAPPPAATPLPPGTRVLLVRRDLPPAVQYEILGRIAVRKQSYGSIDWALDRLAAEARTAGATAVIDVVTGFAPEVWGFATPHATSFAIRITAPSVEAVADMVKIRREWR